MSTAVWLVVVIAVGVLAVATLTIVVVTRARARQRGDALQLAGGLVGGLPDRDTASVRGVWQELPVSVQLVMRSNGSYSETFTVLEAELGTAARSVLLRLRPATAAEVGQVRRGDLADVLLGDPGFDAAYVVEGAPAEAVRLLLDAELRRAIVALGECDLRVPSPDSEARVQLVVRGWHARDPAPLSRALDVLARLAARTGALPAELERAVPLDQVGAPYRGAPDDATRKAARATRERELADLMAQRRGRARSDRRILILVVAVALGLTAAAILGTVWALR